MIYIYTYKEKDYNSYYEVTHLPDFKNVSFPRKESMISDETLASHGITRTPYVPPTPSLPAAKAMKIESFKESRNKEENANITVERLGTFDADSTSRERIRNAVDALSEDEIRTWTDVDGNIVSVNKTQLQSILLACAERSDTLHAKYLRLKEKVEACTTVEEVEAINWEDEDYEEEED